MNLAEAKVFFNQTIGIKADKSKVKGLVKYNKDQNKIFLVDSFGRKVDITILATTTTTEAFDWVRSHFEENVDQMLVLARDMFQEIEAKEGAGILMQIYSLEMPVAYVDQTTASLKSITPN